MSNYHPTILKSIVFFSITLTIFLLAIFYFDFRDENGYLVKPFTRTDSGDYDFYYFSFLKFISEDFSIRQHLNSSLSLLVSSPFDSALSQNFYTKFWLSGPILPFLYHVFGYFNNQIFIFFLYMFFLCFANHLWALSLSNSRLTHFLIFLLPAPVFFSQHISSEIPFYFLFSIFYLLYSKFFDTRSLQEYFYLILVTLLIGLLRPNVLNLIPLLIVLLYFAKFNIWHKFFFSLMLLSFFALFLIYFYPYIMVSKLHSGQFTYFNESVELILSGFYGYIPGLFKLILYKILYFTGVRPSYSSVFDIAQFVKLIPSIFFLLGFIYVFFKGSKKDIILIVFISFPVLYGPAQDRYNLILEPILLFYGLKFFTSNFQKKKIQ